MACSDARALGNGDASASLADRNTRSEEDEILTGVNTLADAVRVTLGPRSKSHDGGAGEEGRAGVRVPGQPGVLGDDLAGAVHGAGGMAVMIDE